MLSFPRVLVLLTCAIPASVLAESPAATCVQVGMQNELSVSTDIDSTTCATEDVRTEAAGEAELTNVGLLQSALSLRYPEAGSKEEVAIHAVRVQEEANSVKDNSTSLNATAPSEYCAHDVAYEGGALSTWGGDDVPDAAACQAACVEKGSEYPLFTYWPDSNGCRCSQQASASSQKTFTSMSGTISCLVNDSYVNVLATVLSATSAHYQRNNAVGEAYFIADIPDDGSLCFTVPQNNKNIVFGATTDTQDDESFPNGVVAHLTSNGEFVPPSGGHSVGYDYGNGHYIANDKFCWHPIAILDVVALLQYRTDEATGKISGVYVKAWTLNSSAVKAKVFLVDDGAAAELS